jgi:hypothetical protein
MVPRFHAERRDASWLNDAISHDADGEAMEPHYWFFLGMMSGSTPSLLVLAILLRRAGRSSDEC